MVREQPRAVIMGTLEKLKGRSLLTFLTDFLGKSNFKKIILFRLTDSGNTVHQDEKGVKARMALLTVAETQSGLFTS